MDYKHAAQRVLDCIGGKDNICRPLHCRLRLVMSRQRKGQQAGAGKTPRGRQGAFLRHKASCRSSL